MTTISGDTGIDKVQDEAITPTAYVCRIKQLVAQNSTSGTSIDFTGIPSWVKKITVMFSGVSTNGTSAVQVQLGDSGGIENTGYISNKGTINNTTVFVGSSSIGFTVSEVASVSITIKGIVILNNISSNTWVINSSMSDSGTQVTTSTGSKTLSGTLDRIRITTVNGTDLFDAGMINVMVEG